MDNEKKVAPEELKPAKEEALSEEELDEVSAAEKPLLCTVMTNLANMRHEMLKAVAQNLRS